MLKLFWLVLLRFCFVIVIDDVGFVVVVSTINRVYDTATIQCTYSSVSVLTVHPRKMQVPCYMVTTYETVTQTVYLAVARNAWRGVFVTIVNRMG